MKLGIIADTHGNLPKRVFDIFKKVDFIFHAGDIGDPNVISELELISPVFAVYGNVDIWPLTSKYPNELLKEIDSKYIYLIHDIVSVKHISYSLFKKNSAPNIVIYGHTHKPKFEFFRNIYYLNPGSVSNPRGGYSGSIALLDLNSDSLEPKFFEI